MSSTDFEIGSESAKVFQKAQEIVTVKNYRIVHRVKDRHIEATGTRDLNGILFAILILGLLASIVYGFSHFYSPSFLIYLIMSIVFAIMIFVSYFSSPRNRIYLDIVPNNGGTYTVNMTATGDNAESLMETIRRTSDPGKNQPKPPEGD